MKVKSLWILIAVFLLALPLSCICAHQSNDEDVGGFPADPRYNKNDSFLDSAAENFANSGPQREIVSPEGIWEDPDTGLMWQVTPSMWNENEYFFANWEESRAHCERLELGGFDDWRLPSISELRSLIRGCRATVTGGMCTITDECNTVVPCQVGVCNGCPDGRGPNGCYWAEPLKGTCNLYWSSTAAERDDSWIVSFYSGYIADYYREDDYIYTRCVRTSTILSQ